MTSERGIIKVRVHDGIVGLLYIGSIALAALYNVLQILNITIFKNKINKMGLTKTFTTLNVSSYK
ncbi:MAG TPA: hypothetical protein EYQ68_08490 [Cytophagales bacterium]|jgi:hypothetical protein|nr:hypothetical protein [Cytophagales bacterium]